MQQIAKQKFTIIGANQSDADIIARPYVSYWKDAWRRFRKNKLALIAFIVLAVMILLCIFAPIFSPYEYESIDPSARLVGPCLEHPFGTDKLGRDVWTRVWIGGRVSFTIGIVGALISAVVGCIYGGIAAYFGGIVDNIMMRIVEVLISVPYLIVVIVLSVVLNSSNLPTLILAMTITGWCGTARFVRAQMLKIKSEEYTLAAKALGVSPWKTVTRHFIPNTIGVIIVSVTFDIPGYIFSESFLSYMNMGIQPPGTSWGVLASSAQAQFTFYPNLLFFPVLMIALTMLCFTLLGDGLRDALDPRSRK